MKSRLLVDYSRVPQRPNPAELHRALEMAVTFEHAIIPLYLYALYSVNAKRNRQIAELLESVVKDEMLHMMLACNLLNALGGAPDLRSPRFFPQYPGPLPGTLAAGMTVKLARFSLKQIRTFMAIEQPDDPLDFPDASDYGFEPERRLATVGDHYRGIRKQIEGRDELFVKPPRNQVVDKRRMPELIAVTNAETACTAIDTIIEQGEGNDRDPRDDDGDYSHYYKFQQIVKLHRLVPNRYAGKGAPADQQHIFLKNRIYYNWKAVWRVPSNPKAASYPPGKARRACETFNYTYTCLLRTLHGVVNGRPQDLPDTFGLMFSLKQQALEMMSGRSTGGVPTGPSFEYQPVNPT